MEPEASVDLLRYVRIALRGWRLSAGLAAVFALVALVYGLSQPQALYTASVRLLLNPAGVSAVVPYQTLPGQNPSAEGLAATITEFVRSDFFLDSLSQRVGTRFDGIISGMLLPRTNIYRLSVTHANPNTAIEFANTAADALTGQTLQEAETDSSPQALLRQRMEEELRYLDMQIADLRAQLQAINPTDSVRGPLATELSSQLRQAEDNRIKVLSALAPLRQQTGSAILLIDRAAKAEPARPDRTLLYVPLGALFGLLLGSGIAIARDYMKGAFHSAEEVREKTGLPVLGRVGPLLLRRDAQALVAARRPDSVVAEDLRRLWVTLQALDPQPKILLLTAPLQSREHTLLVANLGVTLARAGQRVLLVDADLRQPSLSALFGMESDTGLATVLERDDERVFQRLKETPGRSTTVKGLLLLPAGLARPHAAELLTGPALRRTLEALREAPVDRVLICGAPALATAESAPVAAAADGVLLVVELDETPQEAVTESAALLAAAGGRLAGIVLTNAPAPRKLYLRGRSVEVEDEVAEEAAPQAAVPQPGTSANQAAFTAVARPVCFTIARKPLMQEQGDV
jgi:succinoglycan biosynthesis transport protein ExoP